jgi:hypothetical protein
MTGLREYATPCPADHTSSHGRARTTRRPYPGVLVSWRYERDRRIKRAFVRGPRRPAGGYRCAWCGIVEPPEAASEWTRPPRAIIARTRLLRSSIIEQFSPMSEGRRDPRRSHFRRESLRGGDRRPFYRAQMRVHHLVQADRREALSKVSKPTVDRLVGKMIRLPLAGRGHRRAWCGDRGTAEGETTPLWRGPNVSRFSRPSRSSRSSFRRRASRPSTGWSGRRAEFPRWPPSSGGDPC